MTNPLQSLSFRELWALFPIVLSPHQPQWADWAQEETGVLSAILADFSPVIHHIGSTAVLGIYAKPIIDMLVEVSAEVERAEIRKRLEKAGYICMAASDNGLSFNNVYMPNGYAKKVFHVHVRTSGDNEEILFRDYLRSHSDTARTYEALKQSLLSEYKHNRDGYTEAKTAFVKQVMDAAKRI